MKEDAGRLFVYQRVPKWIKLSIYGAHIEYLYLTFCNLQWLLIYFPRNTCWVTSWSHEKLKLPFPINNDIPASAFVSWRFWENTFLEWRLHSLRLWRSEDINHGEVCNQTWSKKWNVNVSFQRSRHCSESSRPNFSMDARVFIVLMGGWYLKKATLPWWHGKYFIPVPHVFFLSDAF